MDSDDRPYTETWTQHANAESTSTNLEEMASFFPTKKVSISCEYHLNLDLDLRTIYIF